MYRQRYYIFSFIFLFVFVFNLNAQGANTYIVSTFDKTLIERLIQKVQFLIRTNQELASRVATYTQPTTTVPYTPPQNNQAQQMQQQAFNTTALSALLSVIRGGQGGSGQGNNSQTQNNNVQGPAGPAGRNDNNGNNNNNNQIDAKNCDGKKHVVVGFRGLPGRDPKNLANSSDGVDSAVKKFGGKVFEYSQLEAAKAYLLSQNTGELDKNAISIVGHSAGANTAVSLANFYANKNINIVALILADPSAGSAGSINQKFSNVTRGLFSNSPSYRGVRVKVGQNVDFPNLGHLDIDNKIEDYVPCKVVTS